MRRRKKKKKVVGDAGEETAWTRIYKFSRKRENMPLVALAIWLMIGAAVAVMLGREANR